MTSHINLVGMELCKVLGLNAKIVSEISFRWKAGQIETVDVEFIFPGDQDHPIVQCLKRYKLVEISESIIDN